MKVHMQVSSFYNRRLHVELAQMSLACLGLCTAKPSLAWYILICIHTLVLQSPAALQAKQCAYPSFHWRDCWQAFKLKF